MNRKEFSRINSFNEVHFQVSCRQSKARCYLPNHYTLIQLTLLEQLARIVKYPHKEKQRIREEGLLTWRNMVESFWYSLTSWKLAMVSMIPMAVPATAMATARAITLWQRGIIAKTTEMSSVETASADNEHFSLDTENKVNILSCPFQRQHQCTGKHGYRYFGTVCEVLLNTNSINLCVASYHVSSNKSP